MQGLLLINDIVGMLVSVLVMLIIIQFVIGLLFAFNVVNPSNQFLMSFYQSINSLLDPILRPIRKIMPDTGAIDFSPIVLILGLNILQAVVGRAVLSLA
ncbi:MAG: YggT family protein [Erythrobacter sp.]|nr:YggT family protein [Erythrobacter sp.]